MAWIAPIGSSPDQLNYRLGQQHGCTAGAVDDAQFDHRTERERPLIWIGGALAELGIQAGTELTEDQFDLARAMVKGFHPHTGEQLVEHKLGVPREAKVQLAPLVHAIEGVAKEADVDVADVLRHRDGKWAGRTSKRMLDMFRRAQRAVEREGEMAALRADHAGQLADAADLSVEDIWGIDVYRAAVANLTKTIAVTGPDGIQTEKVVNNRVVVGNLAYGFDVGVNKSVSEALQWGDERFAAELETILTDAVKKTFGWLEDNTAYGMRGHHGDGSTARTTSGNGYAGWMMIHRTARPTERRAIGDPHWHAHITFANMTKGEDDKWSTVAAGGRDLMRHAAAADRLLQAAVRHALTERYGMVWRRSERTRNWEIAAIPDEAILEFSQRGADIAKMLRSLGFTEHTASATLKRMVQQDTRRAKTDTVSLPDSTLREYFQQRARDAGLDPDGYMRTALSRTEHLVNDEPPTLLELATLLQDVNNGLTAHARRFSRLDALCAVADALPTGASHEEIETLTDQVLDHASFVQLSKGVTAEATVGECRQLGAEHMSNAALYTTQDIVTAEKVIAAAAEASNDDQTGIRVSAATAEMAASTIEATNGFPLSLEQHRELLNVVTSGRGIDALIGGPGSGKTTLMEAVRIAYEAEGFVVAGTSTQGVAKVNLQAESGIPSRTVAQWLWRIDNGEGLRGVDVLVLDEAGMTNDRDRAKLYRAAAESGTKILEIGDPKQLRGVGCGSMFAVVHKLVDGGRLLDNRRQADEDERAAITAWRDGNYGEALTSWADRDRLVVGETIQDTTAAMLATWMDQRLGAPDSMAEMRGLLMVAATNEQVERLNAGAQAIRDVQGELGPGRTYHLVGGREQSLHENDHVMVRVNQCEPGEPDALNGFRGIITRIHPDGRVDVTWERNASGGPVQEQATFTAEYVAGGGLNLGYALTIHKSQGLTIGETWTGPDNERRGGAVLFDAAGADNPGSFVAASRHRWTMWMFLARRELETHQDEYLMGVPKSTFARTRRVITKLIDHARATEVNANDRPTLVDLGLLDAPEFAATRSRPRHLPSADGRARDAERDVIDAARRATAADVLAAEWGPHAAVQSIINGPAFGTVARWLHHIATNGGDPRAVLRRIDPDEMTRPQVRDPSRVVAAVLKRAAYADPHGRNIAACAHNPFDERAADLERLQREQVADLLREQWRGHTHAEAVIAGPAFGAVTNNLATAVDAGHDPREVLNAIDPAELDNKHNPSAFLAWRIRKATSPDEQRLQHAHDGILSPPDGRTRLDVLVPVYERTIARLDAPRAAAPNGEAASPPRPRDAMWPSWLPGTPDPDNYDGRDRSVATACAADARRIRARVVELGRNAARERPEWVEQLGPVPEHPAQRARYLAAIATIAAYREQHTVTGPDPLGPEPTSPGRAYRDALRAQQQLVAAAQSAASDGSAASTPALGADATKAAAVRRGDTSKHAGAISDLAGHQARRIIQQQHERRQRHERDTTRHTPKQGPRPGV